jgi:HTH-type transcriptional regulator, sugar sensing transcriptional regulator
METKILEDLGFTNAEIKVYLALLELGSATAGPIIAKSALQSSVVHMTLNNLVTKGFVSFIKEGQRNHYQAADPKNISIYIEEKKKQFEQLLPELMQKQQMAKEKSEVITFIGIKGVKELLYELLDAGGKEHHAYGSTAEGLMLGDTFWINYHKRRAEKGVKAKLLFNESLRKWVEVNRGPKAEYKFSTAGFEPITETIIRNDKIGIIIYTEIPLGILIHNRAAAASYDKFFEVLWKIAKR